MARLVLSLGDQVLAEYNMTKERYTIGRLPDNDVRIDNPSVSGHHCLIINILNDSFLEDLNSTNGTYVGGKLIKKHALQNGDTITIGHHQLRYVDSQASDPEQEEFEATMVISQTKPDPSKIQAAAEAIEGASDEAAAAADDAAGETTADEAPEAPEPAAATSTAAVETAATAAAPKGPALPTAKLQVLSGKFAGRELELSKALTTLGRPGIQVAAITRRSEGFFIVHVESAEGRSAPSVNGDELAAQARKLEDNDILELAGVKMGFYLT
ncbi:MAG: FHA domain-containing protein [Pseudomonadota bacterium]